MIKNIVKNQRSLVITGLVCVILCGIFAIVSLFDPTEILGINRWIKPMKFLVSIAIFVWTTAVYLNFINGYEKTKNLISWGMIAIFFVEMFIIILQALRGTTSHFNYKTPVDSLLYAIMGVSIVLNTILAGYLTYLYFKAEIDLPPAIIWGMRLGLILFLASSFEGGYMASQIGHSVGVADGGNGLPLINWSTSGGDLRVAHFIGMHAFQIIPLFAYTLEKYRVKNSISLTFIFSVFYLIIFSFVFIQALLGNPFLGKIYGN